MTEVRQRFERLLKAMASGVPASQTLSEGPATSSERAAASSSGTQTRQDTKADASQTDECKSRDKRP